MIDEINIIYLIMGNTTSNHPQITAVLTEYPL